MTLEGEIARDSRKRAEHRGRELRPESLLDRIVALETKVESLRGNIHDILCARKSGDTHDSKCPYVVPESLSYNEEEE